MRTYVALLRGVNVGGNNIVSMKALKSSFERLGFDDVSTFITSGNVLFRSKSDDPRALEKRIDRMLARDHGLPARTVVRSREEMTRLVKKIDATWDTSPDWRYNVMFLRHAIDSKEILGTLAPKPEIERVVYCPGALLWCARIDAITRTAMLKVASRPEYKEMTIRNVNTTRKLLALMERMDSCD